MIHSHISIYPVSVFPCPAAQPEGESHFRLVNQGLAKAILKFILIFTKI
jgi:hypothetical protein